MYRINKYIKRERERSKQAKNSGVAFYSYKCSGTKASPMKPK